MAPDGDGGARPGRERPSASPGTGAGIRAVGIVVFLLVAADGLGKADRIASVTGALLIAAGLALSLRSRTRRTPTPSGTGAAVVPDSRERPLDRASSSGPLDRASSGPLDRASSGRPVAASDM
ncbi:hypothetical protein ABZ958_26810 [Streptomyces sp. NPDC046237]|uniref:hypothetical protein n=1 Tax=Streptomyces sp. NPDC046237 TaxID=3154914 RepID=UPI0033DBE04A